jgi:acyl transferase domain-containing protein
MRACGDVAVVGMACRLPMAANPVELWRLLAHGVDAITEAPVGRWESSGRPDAAPRRGGFLDDVADFDPAFFGISPNEAAAMDPQQRLMLELSWEAVEDAGIAAAALRRDRVGIFVGVALDDYSALSGDRGIDAVTQHTLTGQHRSLIANRTSYFLGLRGPSMAVDTGQSSSLVAVHLACESLRSGESTTALAGGVNLNLAWTSTVGAAGSARSPRTVAASPSTTAPTATCAARAGASWCSSRWRPRSRTATTSTASSAGAPSTTTGAAPG